MKVLENDLIHKNIDWSDWWLYIYGENINCTFGIHTLITRN